MNTKSLLVGLSKEILNRKYMLRAPTIGRCMYPFFREKDNLICILITVPEIQVGDIVIHSRFDALYAHRVTRKYKKNGKIIVITKGDALAYFDIPLKEEDILGKAISIEKNSGTINLETRTWRIINYIIAIYSLSTGLIYQKLCSIKRKLLKNKNNRFIIFASKILRFSIFLPPTVFINFIFSSLHKNSNPNSNLILRQTPIHFCPPNRMPETQNTQRQQYNRKYY